MTEDEMWQVNLFKSLYLNKLLASVLLSDFYESFIQVLIYRMCAWGYLWQQRLIVVVVHF